MTKSRKPNALRSRAIKAAAENPDYSVELARQKWSRIVAENPETPEHVKVKARLAMLEVIAAKGSLEDAEKAARAAFQ